MKSLRRSLPWISAAAIVLSTISVSVQALAASEDADSATYTVVFVPSWNPDTHPTEYPITHAKKGLLTPMIGATHGESYRLFADGQKPTPGLERLSEMGKHDPLDAEIRAAVAAGKAGTLIELSEGSEGPVHAPVSHSFEIQKDSPLVSLVGMIAPSPDWFYGVSSVNLRNGSTWVDSASVTAYAWDSGGDAGATYLADDADLDPKQPTRPVMTGHFLDDGERKPVGVFVFKRIPTTDMDTTSR